MVRSSQKTVATKAMSKRTAIFKENRNVRTRAIGLMKKATVLSKLGAKVEVIVSMNGQCAKFQSHDIIDMTDVQMYGPRHFESAADNEIPKAYQFLISSSNTLPSGYYPDRSKKPMRKQLLLPNVQPQQSHISWFE